VEGTKCFDNSVKNVKKTSDDQNHRAIIGIEMEDEKGNPSNPLRGGKKEMGVSTEMGIGKSRGEAKLLYQGISQYGKVSVMNKASLIKKGITRWKFQRNKRLGRRNRTVTEKRERKKTERALEATRRQRKIFTTAQIVKSPSR